MQIEHPTSYDKKDKAVLTDGFVLMLLNHKMRFQSHLVINLYLFKRNNSNMLTKKTNKAGLTDGLTFIRSCEYINIYKYNIFTNIKKQMYQILSLENRLVKAAGMQTSAPCDRIKDGNESYRDTISNIACITCVDVIGQDINSKFRKATNYKYNPMNMNDIKKCKANLTAGLTPIHIFFTNVNNHINIKD